MCLLHSRAFVLLNLQSIFPSGFRLIHCMQDWWCSTTAKINIWEVYNTQHSYVQSSDICMPTMALCKRWQFISSPIEVGEFLLILIKTNSIKRFIPFTCTAIFFHNSGVRSRTTKLYLLKRRTHRQFNYKEKENQPVTASNRQNHAADSLCLQTAIMVKGCHMNHATPWTIRDLNPGPPRYERGALTNWANGPE